MARQPKYLHRDNHVRDAWLQTMADKKRLERKRRKAAHLGLATVPPWLWHNHPPGCQCYDCLWGDIPTGTLRPVHEPRVGGVDVGGR